MNDWFEWNGVKCTQYGIHVSEHPPITFPAERVDYTEVPGRSGSLTTLEGETVYDDMTLTVTCFVTDTTRLSEIGAWLRGSGNVTFANRQDGFYHARVENQISFEKLLRGNAHCSFEVNFRCQPFFYLADVQPITLTTSGALVTNSGNVLSEPIIQVTLTGDADIAIGGYYFDITGLTGTVTINSQLMEVYQDYVSRNANMSGDFPLLLPGVNYILWSNNVSQIVIAPNWRSL